MIIPESSIGNDVLIRNRRYSFFAGNNYLGLAGHPAIKKDAILAIEKYGISFSASRQTSGTSELHLELEKLLAEFKNKPDAVTFASGYLGNRILLHALSDSYTAIFIDESSHASIMDGIPRGLVRVIPYHHCDPWHLELLLEKNDELKPLIITDGIFALTGRIAPLDKIHALSLRYNAIVVVDDAHATGILGENGRGTPEHFHLEDAGNIYQTESLSKALGCFGGFIAADREIIDYIRTRSNVYQASTSLPPHLAAAGCSSLKIVMNQPEFRARVIENAGMIRNGIISMGFKTTMDKSPIIPLIFDFQNDAEDLSSFLSKNQIIVPFIHYPGSGDKFLLRITASALHTPDQINELLNVIDKWRKNHEINQNDQENQH